MKGIQSPNRLYPQIFDSHCHLYHLHRQAVELAPLLQGYTEEGLSRLLNVVLEEDQETWDWHLRQAEIHQAIRLSIGIHPNDAHAGRGSADASVPLEKRLETLQSRAEHPKVIAIGETGLDFYHGTETYREQAAAFRGQIRIAQQTGKPIVIHNRDADDALIEILSAEELSAGGIIHCFNGSIPVLNALLPKNFYFSFAGNLTYRNAQNLREAAAEVPIERLLIETDAPFLAPQPVRGQLNHSGFVGHVLEFLAEIKGMNPEALLKILTSNWNRLFPDAAI